MRTWRLNAIDDAHKRIDQAHTEVVEVLLLLAGETLVNRLQTHLTCRDKNSHSLFKVWVELILSHQADVSDCHDASYLHVGGDIGIL